MAGSVQVIVPFTECAPGMITALHAATKDYRLCDVSGSDTAYYELLLDLWDIGNSFIIVEHDVIVRPDTIRELSNCGGAWCGFNVPYFNGVHPGMGCVKFTADLISRDREAVVKAGEQFDGKHPPRHWCRLDASLQWGVLPRLGVPKHIHNPPLGHYRPYGGLPQPSHGCWDDEVV